MRGVLFMHYAQTKNREGDKKGVKESKGDNLGVDKPSFVCYD